MAKVICVEIGQSLIKICEMDDYKSKNPRIYRFVEAQTPEGVITDGFLNQDNMGILKDAIVNAVNSSDIKTKRICFTVVSGKIISREITIPAVKPNMIYDVIHTNLTDYFPIDLSDHETMYTVLETYKDGPNAGKHRVMVNAMDKHMVKQYKKLAAECGYELTNIFFGGDSVFQAVRDNKDADTNAVIKVEEDYTSITIVKAGQMLLQRSIPYGIGDAIQFVLDHEDNKLETYLDVWRLSVRDDLTRIPEVKDCMQNIVNGAARILDFYNSRSGGDTVTKISLVGMGAEIMGFRDLVKKSLDVPCLILSRLNNVTAHTSSTDRMLGTFIGCVGAGLSEFGFYHDEKKKQEAKAVNYTRLSIILGVFFVVLCLLVGFMGYLPYKEQKAEAERLQQLKTMYEPGKAAYEQYKAVSALLENLKAGDNHTKHQNDEILAFLQELEKKLPSDAILTEFGSDDDIATLAMRVSDKEKAAKVIETLRGFDSVMSISVKAMTEVEVDLDEEGSEKTDESGMEKIESAVTYIEFTVECEYYPAEVMNQQ